MQWREPAQGLAWLPPGPISQEGVRDQVQAGRSAAETSHLQVRHGVHCNPRGAPVTATLVGEQKSEQEKADQ